MPVLRSPYSGNYYDIPDDQVDADPGNGGFELGPPGSNVVRSPYSGDYYDLGSMADEFAPPPVTAPQAPAPPPSPDTGVHLMDYLKLYLSGSAQLGRAVNQLVNFSPAGMMMRSLGYDSSKLADNLASSAVDYWNDSLSEGAKTEMAKQFVQKNAFGEYEWGGAGLTTLLGTVAESAPSAMLTAGVGAGITRVAQAFANPIGRSVLVTRAAQLAREGVPEVANQALKKLRLVDKLIGATAFGAAEGLTTGAQDYVNVYDEVLKLPPEKLASNERYQQVYNSTDDTMSEVERHTYAAETVAREAASVAGVQSGLTTALLGAPMGAFFGSLLGRSHIGRLNASRIAAGLTGAAGEAAQETAQSGVEQYVQNRALIDVGADIDPFEGVVNAAVGGGLAGAAVGGALGAGEFHPRDEVAPRGTIPSEEDFRRASEAPPALPGPPGSIQPPGADFVAGAEGVVRRPGEAAPYPMPEDIGAIAFDARRALPAPKQPGPGSRFRVNAQGDIVPETLADELAAGEFRRRRQELGLEPTRIKVPESFERGEATPVGAVEAAPSFAEKEGEPAGLRKIRLNRFLHQHVDTGREVKPEEIEADHTRYFTDESTTTLPVERLALGKPAEDNVGVTFRRMQAAAAGRVPKRAPIDVRAKHDGTYEVIDGNGTVNALRGTALKDVPVRIKEIEVDEPRKPFERRLTDQARTNLVAMREDAAAYKPKLDTGLREIAQEVTGSADNVKLGALKKYGRTIEKTVTDYGGDEARVGDLARGMIIVNTPEQAKRARDAVVARFGLAEGRPEKDSLLLGSTDDLMKASPAGYARIMLNVKGDNGRVYEVQITTPEMLAAKKQGQRDYDVTRSLEAKAVERLRAKLDGQTLDQDQLRGAFAATATPMERTQWNQALERQRKIYVPAFESFLAKSAPNATALTSSPSSASEEAVTGDQNALPAKSLKPAGSPRTELPKSSPSTQKEASAPVKGGRSVKGTVPAGEAAAAPVVLPDAITESPRVQSTRKPTDGTETQRVVTAAGTELYVRPRVVEADRLIASDHPDYPQQLQPRQRGERAASSQQVQTMAATLDPELLGISPEADRGAPIVSKDNIVESGNGRVMAIRKAYQSHPERASAYRRHLIDQGYDIHDERGNIIREPVLVRERVTDLNEDERRRFTVEANQSSTMRLSPVEQALADAQLLDNGTLDLYNADEHLTSGANAPFLRAFVQSLPMSERNQLVDPMGLLSQEGARRLEGALLAKAYGGTDASSRTLGRILESTDDNVRSISNALMEAAPDFARLRQAIADGKVPEQYGIQGELLAGVEQVALMRAAGRSVDELLRQGDFYGDMPAERAAAIRLFYNRQLTRAASYQTISNELRYYAKQAIGQRSDQASLLSEKPPAPIELLSKALDRAQPEERAPKAGRLFAFSRRETVERTPAQEAIHEALEPLIAKVASAVDVRVVDTVDEIPSEGMLLPGDIEGAYVLGGRTVYLVTSNLPTAQRAQEVFMHEVFGHLAMERSPEMGPAIRMVHTLRGMRNRVVTDVWNQVARRQPRLDPEQHAKEVIAVMAEQGVKSSIMDRVIDGARRFLRKLGVNVQPSEVELRTLIARSARAFESDARIGGQAATLAGLTPASTDEQILAALNDMPASPELDGALALQNELATLRNEYPPGAENVPERASTRMQEIEAALEARDRFTPWLDVQGDVSGFAALERAREASYALGTPGRLLFSRAAPADPALQAAMDRVLAKAPESYTMRDRARGLWQKLRNVENLQLKQGLIDQFASVEALERAANNGNLQDAAHSAYKAALATKNLSSVMAAVMMRGIPEYRDGAFQPVKDRKGVVEIFRPLTNHPDGNLLRQWEFFAAANRAKRLKGEKNADGTSREKLFTDDEIAMGLALEEKYPVFRQVLNDWNTLNKQTLDLAEAAGIIDPESRALWERNDYVPFYRAMEEAEGSAQGPRAKRDLANQRAKIKTLEGSEEQIGNVFENMMMNTAHLIDASFKNRAMQQIADLADGVAMNRVELPWEAIQLPDTELARALRAAGLTVGKMTKAQREQWSTVFRRVAPRGPNIVSVMVGGKPVYYEVTDPLLLRSIAGMGQSQLQGVAALLFRGSKKLLTHAITADPAFMLANFVRDTLSTWVQSDASMRPVIDAVRGLKATWAEDENLVTLMMAGAGGGGYYDSNPEDIRKLIASRIGGDAKGFMRTIVSPRNAWRVWRKIGASAENANRIAVFRAVLDAGGSVAEAAYQARDVLNFTMRGDYGAMRWLTETVPFLNARVQGLYRLYRGARDNKKSFLIKGAMILAATMALAAANEDDPEYEELPEWDKDLYWHLFVGGEHFRIPKPFEVGAMFATIPERAWRGLTGRDSGRLVWQRLFAMASDTFAFNPVPQLVKPLIEQYANRSFFTGSPIVGQAEQNLQPEAQFTPFTSETMRELAAAMPDWAPAWIRSPRRLEAAVRAYTGSLGMYVVGASDAVVREAMGYPDPPSQRVYDLPVVQRFFRDENPRYTKYADQMYDYLDQANQVYSTINRYRREERLDEAKELLEENRGKLAVRMRLNRLATQVRRINEQIRIIQQSRTLDGDQKRDRIDSLVERKNAVTRQVAPMADLF